MFKKRQKVYTSQATCVRSTTEYTEGSFADRLSVYSVCSVVPFSSQPLNTLKAPLRTGFPCIPCVPWFLSPTTEYTGHTEGSFADRLPVYSVCSVVPSPTTEYTEHTEGSFADRLSVYSVCSVVPFTFQLPAPPAFLPSSPVPRPTLFPARRFRPARRRYRFPPPLQRCPHSGGC